jgi:hypothetical protein
MALDVTVGGNAANSFCTVAEADEWIAASHYPGDAWDAQTDGEKESLLVLAGMLMNNMSWCDYEVYEDQAMSWPRWSWESAREYEDGDVITIPAAIRKAQAWIAYDVVYRGLQGASSPSEGRGADAISSLSLFGDVSISFGGAERSLADGTAFARAVQSEHWPIYALISAYVSEVHFTRGRTRAWWRVNKERDAPRLLDAVVSGTL